MRHIVEYGLWIWFMNTDFVVHLCFGIVKFLTTNMPIYAYEHV